MSDNKREPGYKNGNFYMIDRGFRNGGIVKLISHSTYYCTVEDPDNGARWETMLHRLTVLLPGENRIPEPKP